MKCKIKSIRCMCSRIHGLPSSICFYSATPYDPCCKMGSMQIITHRPFRLYDHHMLGFFKTLHLCMYLTHKKKKKIFLYFSLLQFPVLGRVRTCKWVNFGLRNIYLKSNEIIFKCEVKKIWSWVISGYFGLLLKIVL